jgi:S1-C subfamily serine protease
MKAPVFASAQVFAKSRPAPTQGRADEGQRKLGAQVQDLTPELAALFNVAIDSGVIVADVTAGGPAAFAGIERGDIITKINNTATRSANDIERLVRAVQSPAQIKLEVIKKGKPTTIVIDLPS